jgi:hypothetical protein
VWPRPAGTATPCSSVRSTGLGAGDDAVRAMVPQGRAGMSGLGSPSWPRRWSPGGGATTVGAAAPQRPHGSDRLWGLRAAGYAPGRGGGGAPAPGGRGSAVLKRPRARSGWITMQSAVGRAGIGISRWPWPCWWGCAPGRSRWRQVNKVGHPPGGAPFGGLQRQPRPETP